MSRMARVFLGLLAGAMVGFWLNAFALIFVISANGLPEVPPPFEQIIEAACWPSALMGVPPQEYFYTHALRNILVNVLGWTAVGLLPGLLPSRRSSSSEV